MTYRSSLISFEQVVRAVQDLEDRIKLDVRNGLSRLLEGRETIRIQAQAVNVARRRVDSTSEFLEAGRAEIRDVLEAQDALLTAQNSLTSALVNYRVNELSLQRDLGVLTVRSPWSLARVQIPRVKMTEKKTGSSRLLPTASMAPVGNRGCSDSGRGVACTFCRTGWLREVRSIASRRTGCTRVHWS